MFFLALFLSSLTYVSGCDSTYASYYIDPWTGKPALGMPVNVMPVNVMPNDMLSTS